jgi:hypothetical protein
MHRIKLAVPVLRCTFVIINWKSDEIKKSEENWKDINKV